MEKGRVIDHQVLYEFCCCSKQAMFKAIKALERAGFLKVRKLVLSIPGLQFVLSQLAATQSRQFRSFMSSKILGNVWDACAAHDIKGAKLVIMARG